jgi:hypothetical protein
MTTSPSSVVPDQPILEGYLPRPCASLAVMLLDEPITCFLINKEEEVFDEEEQETLSHWTVERFKVGGFTLYQSVVEVATGYDKSVYVLNILPNRIGTREHKVYFELENTWLPKYFLVVLMDTTSENSNVLTVTEAVDEDVDFLGGLIVTHSDQNYSREDLQSQAYDSQFWSMVQGGPMNIGEE